MKNALDILIVVLSSISSAFDILITSWFSLEPLVKWYHLLGLSTEEIERGNVNLPLAVPSDLM